MAYDYAEKVYNGLYLLVMLLSIIGGMGYSVNAIKFIDSGSISQIHDDDDGFFCSDNQYYGVPDLIFATAVLTLVVEILAMLIPFVALREYAIVFLARCVTIPLVAASLIVYGKGNGISDRCLEVSYYQQAYPYGIVYVVAGAVSLSPMFLRDLKECTRYCRQQWQDNHRRWVALQEEIQRIRARAERDQNRQRNWNEEQQLQNRQVEDMGRIPERIEQGQGEGGQAHYQPPVFNPMPRQTAPVPTKQRSPTAEELEKQRKEKLLIKAKEEEASRRELAEELKIEKAIEDALRGEGPIVAVPQKLLAKWTDNFTPTRLLGSGGFGDVFSGSFLSSNSTNAETINPNIKNNNNYSVCFVAVKRLSQDLKLNNQEEEKLEGSNKPKLSHQEQQQKQFQKEISILTAFKHNNIIRLLGYTNAEINNNHNNSKMICLIYELASKGDLRNLLLSNTDVTTLDYRLRIRIAFDIACALNYLHCNAESPIFHRDIKSANIVLMNDYTAKLIDWGLAKYIPDNKTMIATTTTGALTLFGTPGYLCDRYINTHIYDRKSEVYSLGVVLAELFTGKVQNENYDGNITYLQDNIFTFPSDNRAGNWPIECEKAFRILAINCMKSHSERISAMISVVRSLGSMKSDYCKYNGLEKTLIDKSLENQIKLEQLEARSAIIERQKQTEEKESQKICVNCLDAFHMNNGISCEALNKKNQHFLCHECFTGSNLTHQLAPENRRRFIQFNCQLVCQWCLPDNITPFSNQSIASQLNEEEYSQYSKVIKDSWGIIWEKEYKQQREHRESISDFKSDIIQKRRLFIAESILTLKCPTIDCQQAIIDFDGCFAVKCSFCNNYFCGWCLSSCGKDSHSAHSHVRNCSKSLRRGTYGTPLEFKLVHKQQRIQSLKRYLSDLPKEDRKNLIAALQVDLEGIEITVKDIM